MDPSNADPRSAASWAAGSLCRLRTSSALRAERGMTTSLNSQEREICRAQEGLVEVQTQEAVARTFGRSVPVWHIADNKDCRGDGPSNSNFLRRRIGLGTTRCRQGCVRAVGRTPANSANRQQRDIGNANRKGLSSNRPRIIRR